jgi:hypothetical protein
MKTCTRCGFVGENDKFYKQKTNSKDGYQSHCKVCDNARVKKWELNNPEKAKQHAKTAEQNRLNDPKRRVYRKQLKKTSAMKALNNASYAKRRAAKICRTPKWLTEQDHKVMKAFYSVAQMLTKVNNEAWHVDHNIPLQAKLVSGLHVPKNLVLMRGIENETKRNFYIVG